jgi:uncharacterized membrane protein YfcA
MKKKDFLGYLLLPVGLAGVFVGLRMVSGGDPKGWLALVPGILFAVLSYRFLTGAPTASTPTTRAKPPPAGEAER